jgi:hypothetical protein
MGAVPKYNHVPKTENKNHSQSSVEHEKKQIQETVEKIKDLIDSADKAKKAAQIIEEMLKHSK